VNTEAVNPHLTTKIVVSYVRNHRLAPDQLADLITSVHRAIGELGQPPAPEEVLTPAVSIRRSVNQNHVTCLDCGYWGKTLRRHINTRHSLSPDEYRQRWGLRSNHLLTAPAYSEHRSAMAKARGFGRKLATPAAKESPVAENAAGNAEAKSTRRSRPATNSNVVSEMAAAPTRARRRRSRAALVTSPSV
jgi:predicted transcriptional regulator